MTDVAVPLPAKLAIAVTFFFDESRLPFLQKISQNFPSLASEVSIWVVTHQADSASRSKISKAVNHPSLKVVSPTLMGHPYLLPWSHRAIFRDLLENDQTFTHFLYLEDDLEFTSDNVRYWLRSRQDLDQLGLIPGFVRFELTSSGKKMSSDIYRVHNLYDTARVTVGPRQYVNFRYPYQGLYLMDRPLLGDFLRGKTASPDFGTWRIREKASQGLIYSEHPEGTFSRSFVGLTEEVEVDPGALVHHLPNNYADGGTKYGSIEISRLLATNRIRATPFLRDLFSSVVFRRPKRRKLFVRRIF